MYALAKQVNICFGKMVLKLGILIMAIAIFSSKLMFEYNYLNAQVLEGYIQKDINVKEQSEYALFLLKNAWEIHLKEKYVGKSIKSIKDGIVYIQLNKRVNARNIKINVAEVNRSVNSKIEVVPQLATKEMHSRAKITNIVKDSNAILAINGTYFKQKTGTPLGVLVIDNEIISGPIYNRVGFLINDDGFTTSQIGFEGVLKKGDLELKIDNINQPRLSKSHILIYTDAWGSRSPEIKVGYKQMAIYDNKIVAISPYPLFIPINGYVISAAEEKLKDFSLGDEVYVDYTLTNCNSDYNHIISGGPYLMKDGKIYVDAKEEKLVSITGRNPRTAIGYTKDNDLILVTVEGRKEGVSGVTLEELAQIMKKLGCYEAINLDGGSSTVMYVNGKTFNGSNLEGSVKVSNALVVKVKS